MSIQTNLFDGLIVDNFAGGGGASTGIELAIGRPVDIAINHDPDAIAMHKANHPYTKHYCENVWEIDPRKATKGRSVALAWFSPDCKHFSKAKGGKPVAKNIRGLAWVAVRWAATVRPRVIILENVEEFKTWGPIKDGQPIADQKGRTFNSFVNALKKHGYQVEWRELKACDYGAPTIRKRFFMIARCDGKPIVFPEPTHGENKIPYRTASECIDWSIPCPSIFDTSEEIKEKYGIRAVRPLAENTLKRIARGIQKFVIESAEPYIVQMNFDNPPQSLRKPMTTQTTVNHHMLVVPSLIQYHTETAHSEVRGQALDEPVMTLDTSNRYGLVSAFLAKHYGGAYSGAGSDMTDPVHTITTRDRFGLITVHGVDYQIVDIGMRMLEPKELYAAQGFPIDYKINFDVNGKKYSKTAQVARCGNSVPPPFAEALVRANLPELCGEKITTMKRLEEVIV